MSEGEKPSPDAVRRAENVYREVLRNTGGDEAAAQAAYEKTVELVEAEFARLNNGPAESRPNGHADLIRRGHDQLARHGAEPRNPPRGPVSDEEALAELAKLEDLSPNSPFNEYYRQLYPVGQEVLRNIKNIEAIAAGAQAEQENHKVAQEIRKILAEFFEIDKIETIAEFKQKLLATKLHITDKTSPFHGKNLMQVLLYISSGQTTMDKATVTAAENILEAIADYPDDTALRETV